MPSVTTLAFLLLPALVHGSADQQDLLCTNSYTEFESASVGSNVSGTHTRNQLYEAFYTPNQHLPYSVLVTYQLVLDNGTRLNLSSDEDCSSELWLWMSSPVFLALEATYLNRRLLYTLNYFMEWIPPHVFIGTSVSPCQDKMSNFLNRMTATVSSAIDYRISDGWQPTIFCNWWLLHISCTVIPLRSFKTMHWGRWSPRQIWAMCSMDVEHPHLTLYSNQSVSLKVNNTQ